MEYNKYLLETLNQPNDEYWEKLLDYNILYNSMLKCIKGVYWKRSSQLYAYNYLINFNKLVTSLTENTYEQKPFICFQISERGKTRDIRSIHISDRVLQRTLCDEILNPLLKKYLIYDNGASIKEKGIDFTRNRLKAHMEKYYRKYKNNGYALLIDYSKYFDNINHEKLIELLKEKIQSPKVIALVEYLISTFGEKGVGLGSQLSQTAGIFFPTKLDNYVKTVKGCKYYGRYMDDSYILHPDKKFLQDLLKEYKKIAEDLDIKLNTKKTQIVKINKITFLKSRYFFSDTGKVIVKPIQKNITRERKKLKKLYNKVKEGKLSIEKFKEQYKSWRGNILKQNSFNNVKKLDKLFKELLGGLND